MPAPIAPVPGSSGKFYRNTGTYAVPVWDLVPNVRDLDFPIDFTDVDVSSRLGGGFKQHEPGLADIASTLLMLYNPLDPDMQAFIAAAWAREAVEFLIMDAAHDEVGSAGIRATFKFFKSARGEPLDGMMTQTFDIKLSYGGIGGALATPPLYVIAI